MSLIELKAFNAVATGGGFVRAAEILHRSQPTITAQIKALESRYGVELFYRTRGQSAQLTPLGHQLLQTTRSIFQLEKDAHSILRGGMTLAHNILRLGVIAPRSAMEQVANFSHRFPDVSVNMRIGNSAQILQWLLNYEVDVGILGAHERNPMLYMRSFSKPEIVLLGSTGKRYGKNGLLRRDDFARETLILREPGSETRSLIETALIRHGWQPARRIEVSSREGIAAAAEQGLGLAPISLSEVDRRPGIRVLRFAEFQIHGEMFIACMNNRQHIPSIRSLIDT